MKISLLIATYNWPEALDLCLKSVAAQSTPPHEILIADDGSGAPTRRLVEEFARTSAVPVRHIWHEDDGFRLTVIRNKAIAAAEGDYIVQIDGDVILHRHFIRDHAAFAERGAFVSGSRAMIGRKLAARLLRTGCARVAWYTPGMEHILNGIRIPALRSIFKEKRGDHIRGCNMAFWRDDLLAVNGYNEEMTGWGHEDSELVARLRNRGVRQHTLKFAGFVFHIWHPLSSREKELTNQAVWHRARQEGTVRCTKGVDRYL